MIEAFPHRAAGLPGWRRITSLGVVLMLFSGLLLQACVYLYRLHSIWREVGIKVQGDLIPQWLRGRFCVCLSGNCRGPSPALGPFAFQFYCGCAEHRQLAGWGVQDAAAGAGGSAA